MTSTSLEWGEDQIEKIHKYILRDKVENISVYRLKVLTAFDAGHALGVIAEGITQDNFRSNKAKRESTCSRGVLLFPVDKFKDSIRYKFTPRGNLNFYPANSYHYDLKIIDKDAFAVNLLNSLRDRSTKWVLLGNDGPRQGSYTLQARIAYSNCIQQFGVLDPDSPPERWIDGVALSASEQVNTIAFLAQRDLVEASKVPINLNLKANQNVH